MQNIDRLNCDWWGHDNGLGFGNMGQFDRIHPRRGWYGPVCCFLLRDGNERERNRELKN